MADSSDTNSKFTFVGRKSFLNDLDNAWEKHKVFGIFGMRSVGKSVTVREFLKKKMRPEWRLIFADMRAIRTETNFQNHIFSQLGMWRSTEGQSTWKDITQKISKAVQDLGDTCAVMLFDNVEDTVEGEFRDSFLHLCVELIDCCKNIKIFLTSTTNVEFAKNRRTYYRAELMPMDMSDASDLLTEVAPDVDFEGQEDKILKFCEGLPLAIAMVGSEMEANEGMLEVDLLADMLERCRLKTLSADVYPPEERIADVYRQFIDRLPENLQQRLAMLAYIPGSFTTEHVTAILGHEKVSTAMDQTVIPLRRRHMIQFDPITKRFDIHGILRECLEVYIKIRSITETGRRYCRHFTEVMDKLAGRIITNDYVQGLTLLSREHANLQKLISEVIHTDGQSFHSFIQMIASGDHLLGRVIVENHENLFQQWLETCNKFGDNNDTAVLRMVIGSYKTNILGDFKAGEINYMEAEKSLETCEEPSLEYAILKQKLGWNLCCQERAEESVKVLEDALGLFKRFQKEDVESCLSVYSVLGVAYADLGDFKKAEKYHLETLKRRRRIQGNSHPAIGAVMNNISVMYKQMGKYSFALGHAENALEIKRKNKARHYNMLASFNEVSHLCIILDMHERAKEVLGEAWDMMQSDPDTHRGNLAGTLANYGHLYMKTGKYKEAVIQLEKALDIRKEIMPNSASCIETLAILVMAKVNIGLVKDLQHDVQKVLERRLKFTKAFAHSRTLLDCMLTLYDAYKNNGHHEEEVIEISDTISEEFNRLIRFYKSVENDPVVETLQQEFQHFCVSLQIT